MGVLLMSLTLSAAVQSGATRPAACPAARSFRGGAEFGDAISAEVGMKAVRPVMARISERSGPETSGPSPWAHSASVA